MESAEAALARACTALWAATLSLMTAFMQTQAPAHRYLMARKIAANFELLRAQECYTPATRASFTRLATRWSTKAERLSPHADRPRGGGFGIGALLRG